MFERIVAGMLLAAGLALTGCETVKGVGRDITNASGSVESAFNNRSSRGGK